MAIDWRSIAEQVGALNPDGSEEGCGTDTGRRALEILIGEDNLRAAIDYFISLRGRGRIPVCESTSLLNHLIALSQAPKQSFSR